MIPVNTPLLDGNELKYLQECIQSGWISSEGPFVEEFESKFADGVGRQYGVACSNGSAALDIAVVAAGIGPGDEVILPTLTIISPAASLVRAGARPVLVDALPDTWNMDPAQIERSITPHTKAILVVHLYGLPADMPAIMQIAQRYGLIIIEDAAEMHGQTVIMPPDQSPQPCGSFGLVSTFSFYPNKHVTCGEGGMVVTNDLMIADRARQLRNLCFEPGRRFVHQELGWNYRMTNLQAAVGLAQLERIEQHVVRKRDMGDRYNRGLSDLNGFQLPPPRCCYAENIYWVYGLVMSESLGDDCTQFIRSLSSRGVGNRPFFWPMHEQPVFKKMGLFEDGCFPVAEGLARRGFYIPSGLGLSDAEIDFVCEQVKELAGSAEYGTRVVDPS